jgi:Fe-S cluster assembly protein SufD
MSASTLLAPVAASPFDAWLAGVAQDLPGAGLGWLSAQRGAALARARAAGMPTSKQEGWRYTGLKSLLEQGFVQGAEEVTALAPEDIEEILIPGLDAHRVVLANGRLVPSLSWVDGLPGGVRAGGLRALIESEPELLRGRLGRVAGEGAHVFVALNTAGMDDGFVLLFDAGTRVERPIEIIHLSLGMDEPRLAQPRHLVDLGEGASATVIERYVSLGESLYCTNSVLELSLGLGAELTHYRVQQESPKAFHLAGVYLSQGADSRYHGVNVGLGAAWSRTDLVAGFAGTGAECNLDGLYLAGDGQVMDFHLDIRHEVPGCTSRETFKGILYGKGRAVFDGHVYVARDAQKTDAQLSNRNLVLSRNAEVDTKPQLEILADDVKCSHGTTVGQLDAESLFYLRSRGIPLNQARRMLCVGFAGEVLDAFGLEPLRDYVAAEVGRRLEQAALGETVVSQ